MVIIADVACPYDLYADEVYKAKIEKYGHLTAFIASKYSFPTCCYWFLRICSQEDSGKLDQIGIEQKKS